jgi:hypothetical protein
MWRCARKLRGNKKNSVDTDNMLTEKQDVDKTRFARERPATGIGKCASVYGVGFICAVALLLGGCAASDGNRQAAQFNIHEYERAKQILAQEEAKLQHSGIPKTDADEQIARISYELDALAPRIERMRKVLARKSIDSAEFAGDVQASADFLNRFDTELEPVRSELRKWIAFRNNPKSLLAGWSKDCPDSQLRGDIAELTTSIRDAERDWPHKKEDLQQRLTKLQSLVDQQSRACETVLALANNSAPSLSQLQTVYLIGPSLASREKDIYHNISEFTEGVHNLYFGRTVVLQDLNPDNQRAKWREVIAYYAREGAKPASAVFESWGALPTGNNFDDVSQMIGMSFEHKPPGAFLAETETTPEPAGMAYLAPPGQQNQFGHWQSDQDGREAWHWFPQFLYLSWLLDTHSRITPADYWEYRSAVRQKVVWVGRDPVAGTAKFGTFGSNFTKPGAGSTSRFAGSTYAGKGTFAGSKYATAGSTFRSLPYGARAATVTSSVPTLPRPLVRSSSAGQSFGSS